jgi:hypothetical protein
MLRKQITTTCKKSDWDTGMLANAKWLLGSTLCSNCSSTQEVPALCPIYTDCKGRVETGTYTAQGLWLRDGKVMNKGGTNPPFGIPTDFPPRMRSRKRAPVVIPITPLFPKE